jgi:hypothetical protein
MKTKLVKALVATTLIVASAGALAANMGCCGDLACCLQMLACCF